MEVPSIYPTEVAFDRKAVEERETGVGDLDPVLVRFPQEETGKFGESLSALAWALSDCTSQQPRLHCEQIVLPTERRNPGAPI